MASTLTTIALSGPIRLHLRLGHGSIRIDTRDDLTEAAVRLIPRDPASAVLERFKVELRANTLTVTGPRQGGLADLVVGGSRRERDAVDAVLELPTGTPITIASASDEITINGTCGDADIATSAARLALETVDGDLRLRYGAGDTDVTRVRGSVQLGAGSGAVRLGEVGGSVQCRLGSGQLTVDEARGRLRCRIGAGATDIGHAYSDVDIALGSGPMTIGLPRGVSAHLDLVSGTRQVSSDLPIDAAPAKAARTINVRGRTGLGQIHLFRASAAA